MSNSKKIAILGGGISGLTCAWSLARESTTRLEVLLLEASHRTGGWVHSERMADIGAVHELGPRSLRVAQKAGKITLAMISQLGLESQVIPIKRGHRAAQRRLIYTDKHKLVELPSNLSWLFVAKPPFSRPLLTSVVKEPFVPAMKGEDESIHQFISRRFGSEIAEWVIDPMCRGVFAGSSKSLSMRSCFPLLHNYEEKHGSIIRGMLSKSNEEKLDIENDKLLLRAAKEKWMLYSLQNGLQTLTDTLTTAAEESGVTISTDNPATSLSFDNNQAKITTKDNEYIVDYVISAIPAQALAIILPDDQSKLCASLNSIPAVDVAVVNVEYKEQVIPEQWREAFGYLVPSHQQSHILGTVFDSSTFPELDRKDITSSTRLTVMMGGEWFQELFGDPNNVKTDTLAHLALKSLHNQLGISQEPSDCIVNIHKACIPQYTIGHKGKIDTINECIKGLPLSLVGSSYSGVSVNDCIMNSLQETRTVLAHLVK